MYCIFDIETNGLIDNVSLIHCLSYRLINEEGDLSEINTITSYRDIVSLFCENYIFVGHNIIRYDLPVLKKLLNIDNQDIKCIDTLGLSWYLLSSRKIHSLESWGDELGVKKPVINDWKNLSLQDYTNRCETDVEINSLLFKEQYNYLFSLYDSIEDIEMLYNYTNFKLDCLRDQEEIKISLDIQKCEEYIIELNSLLQEKADLMSSYMPRYVGRVIKHKPKKDKFYKKNGDLSNNAKKWIYECSRRGLDFNSTQTIYQDPDPKSVHQVKKWLFSLDWKPETFKENVKGEKVPQISLPFAQGICPSVKKLYKDHPELENLEGFYRIRHRIGLFESFLKNQKDSKVVANAHGFTNTMRMKHSKPIANLPKVSTFYGSQIRSVLRVENPDTHIMCGADISSLEDCCKQHYIYFLDPDYVNEMRVPGFDPHLDIGLLANLLTELEVNLYKELDKIENLVPEKKKLFKELKSKRFVAKTTNFSAMYGAGPAKIAKTADTDLKEAVNLHKVYWKRNWAVKETANRVKTKIVYYKDKPYTWLYNPVSRLWLFLKVEKDRFSTLNQSTGVYVFDFWLALVRKALAPLGIKVILQYHDELLLICPIELKEKVSKILYNSMERLNNSLKLNVEINISTDWGFNYAQCH